MHHPKFLLESCVDTQNTPLLASNVEQMTPGWPQGPKLDQIGQEMPQKWPKNHILSLEGTYLKSK